VIVMSNICLFWFYYILEGKSFHFIDELIESYNLLLLTPQAVSLNFTNSFVLVFTFFQTVQLKISAIVFLPDHGGVCPIGHVTIGSKSSGTELVHWTQTMTSLRKPVTMWHRLQK